MALNLKPDAAGRVKVFDLTGRKWISTFAIDAREMLGVGAVSLQGPRIEVRKGKKTEVVCSEELRAKVEDGWKRVGPPVDPVDPVEPVNPGGSTDPHPGAPPPGSPAGAPVAPTQYDFHAVDEEQLRIWVASQRIEGAVEMTKPELVEVLERINFEPPAG